MKTLVTGGAGFIGKYVLNSLDKSISFDVLKKRDDDIIGDLNSIDDLTKASVGMECVLHLAAISRVRDCHDNPQKCMVVNVIGTINALEASVKNSVKVFALVSTGEVTWEQNDDRIKSFKPIDNIYGISKLTDELLLDVYCKEHDICGVVFRISSVVFGGTDDNPGKVLPLFINKALHGEEITINTDKSWDFIHVKDVAKKIKNSLQAVSCEAKGEGVQEVDIRSGVKLNLLELAKIIHFLTKSTSKIIYNDIQIEKVNEFEFNDIVAKNKIDGGFIENLKSSMSQYKRAMKDG